MSRAVIDQAVLLVGGRARRLGTLAADVPKCLQPVNGRPFVAYQLELLASQGIRRVVLCTGHLSERVEAVVGDGSMFGLSITVRPDATPDVGTGGALRDAADELDEAFAVEYGDTYLRAPLREICATFEASSLLGLMTVYANADSLEPSNVWLDGGGIRAYGKVNRVPEMKHIDFGLSVLRRTALDLMPATGPADLGQLFTTLIAQRQLGAFEVYERFYEIGTPETLRETERVLRDLHHSERQAGVIR